MFGPRASSSPTPVSGSGWSIARSTHRHRVADRVGVVGGVLGRQERQQRARLGQAEAVAEPHVGELAHQLVHERRGDRRAAVADAAHAGEVVLLELRMAQQRVVDRRHGHDMCETPATRSSRGSASRSSALFMIAHAPADLEQRDHLAVAAGHVEQRHADQRPQVRALLARRPEAANDVLGVGEEVQVRGHRALGEAGRSARVEDRRQVVLAEVVDDQRLAVRQLGARLERQLRARVVDDVLDLGLGEARVDRDRDRTRELDAPEPEHPVGPVGQADRDAIAALHALGAQPTGDARRAVPQLLVGQLRAAVDVDDRRRVGRPLDARAQHLHQRRRAVGVARNPVRTALDARAVMRVSPASGDLDHRDSLFCLLSGSATLSVAGGYARRLSERR